MIKISSIGGFFEEHIEKIILVIVGLICAGLLITRVILSPNTVSYDKRSFSPGTIDDYVYEQAQTLRQKLSQPPDKLEPYKPKADEYLAKLDSSINDIDASLWPVVPYELGAETAVAGVYSLPSIGEVNDVAVEHIRAVAYIPTAEVTPQNPYDKSGNEPNDIDFVTVQGKFDVRQLYDSFRATFYDDVEKEWADPCLVKPVFAAVNLQRQELNGDGTWSDWQNVPRAKIDQYRKMFQIVEDIQDLPPGGLKVQMLQFNNKMVQIDLLQPEAYQIASAKEEWFPPVLHRKYLDLQRKEALEEKRRAKEDEQAKQDNSTDERRNRRIDTGTGIPGRTTTRGGAGFSSPGGIGGDLYRGGGYNSRSRDRGRNRQTTGGPYGQTGRSNDRRRTSRTRTGTNDQTQDLYGGLYGNARPGDIRGGTLSRGPSTNEVYYEFNEAALNRLTDLSKLKEPMLFWHHDDTVEPTKTYRYRIRLGVFNPVAGTNKLSEEDKSQKNKVILWSDFSDVTEPVKIPGRSYFFARDIQEAAKSVTVTVCRYVLGHWYSKDFDINQGESIGDVVENEIEKPKPPRQRGRGPDIRGPDYLQDRYASIPRPEEKTNVPETIDYSTGAVMVDAMPVDDWWGDSSRRSRSYYDMLYSYDGANIEHMPVGTTYWSKDMQSEFSRISKLEREPQEPFKAFGSTRRMGSGPGQGMYDDMMGGAYDNPYQMMDGLGGGRY
jgi:hypothetical protein